MSVYQEMRNLALENMKASEGREVSLGIHAVLCGIVFALLAIAAAIADMPDKMR